MELKYRGIAYKASFTGESEVDSKQMGVQRRKTAEQSVKDALRQPGEELTYRGVRYTR